MQTAIHPTGTVKLTNFSYRDEPELLARLIRAQNALERPVDILTYAGWCETAAALRAHVERYEAVVTAQPVRRTCRAA
jgi:hypothetical protein